MKPPFDLSRYRHVYRCRVRSYHVDRQRVVSYSWYNAFLEEARVEYWRSVGMEIDDAAFMDEPRFFIVRNSCEYFSSAVFDEELLVHTRVGTVRNSSLTMDQVIVSARASRPVVAAEHVMVHVDPETDRPSRIPDDIRSLIARYDNDAGRSA